jgi:Arc/MetJ-type ribon-helix-helix transcriptional regulator
MKRTTITLPDDVFEAAEREAKRRRTSVSEVVREAVAKTLGCQPASEDDRAKAPERDVTAPPQLKIIGIAQGPLPHRAADLDDVLADNWAADIQKSFSNRT